MATSVPLGSTGVAGDLVLQVTPPRAPRNLVTRARLLSSDPQLRDFPVILVQAPGGYGKTSLLAQWRREHLAVGAVVAWVSAQARDEPRRLAQCLAMAMRQAAGRPTFGHTLIEADGPGGLECITVWLAELAQTALNVVLIVDEAERLPAASREALAYLVRNAPPNLRTIVAARPDCNLDIDDLVTYGQCMLVGPETLRFRLEETLELAHSRAGERIDNDTAARLQELTEGWPLGLQLVLTVLLGAADPKGEVDAMAARHGELNDNLVGMLLANLDPDDVGFLTSVSILDHLSPELCREISGLDDAQDRLERMSCDTPVFVTSENGEWLRLHTLARHALRQRFAALPEPQKKKLHGRAAALLAQQGRLEAAAWHALAAGRRELAYDLAERSLYESIMAQGRVDSVIEWLDLLPADELARRPRLLLAAAWSLALGQRNDEAERIVERILAQPDVDDALRCECALIVSGAAVFADDPDRFVELHDPWAEAPPLRDPLLLKIHANRRAFRALLEGDLPLARLRQQQAPRGDFGKAPGFVSRWGELITALTYLWEGQVLLAENLLRPSLAGAEADLGRRHPFTCMLAGLLASAVWERNRPDEAAALLANRLDVLERDGLPEALLLSYRTLARSAMSKGAEHRAIELLEAMYAVGSARNLPRLRIASLLDQVRLHARRYRVQTCQELCERIDAMLAEDSMPRGPLWRRSVEVLRQLARGHAAMAAKDWRVALDALARADELALEMKQGRLHIEIFGLRAFALDRCGERAQPLLREAIDLASAYGLLRVFEDAHPDLGEWMSDVLSREPDRAAHPVRHAPAPVTQERETARPRSTPSMALTPKEREVLELLARNLSNKEIGLAMQVGEETIKWHMKNLFAKLDAVSRKQVVLRARILGLLQQVD